MESHLVSSPGILICIHLSRIGMLDLEQDRVVHYFLAAVPAWRWRQPVRGAQHHLFMLTFFCNCLCVPLHQEGDQR